jgi:hypothetical protein
MSPPSSGPSLILANLVFFVHQSEDKKDKDEDLKLVELIKVELVFVIWRYR